MILYFKISNKFLDIEIEFKYWACVIKYINLTANFWMKNEKYGTIDPHLGQPKNPTGTKSRPKWSTDNR